MRLTSQDERAILLALKENDWTGRWEGRYSGCAVAIWMTGTHGSLRITFTARRGLRLYKGEDTQVRLVLDRIETICKTDLDKIRREWYEELPALPVESHHTARLRKSSSSRPTLLGYGVCQVLQWMGAHHFNSFDAINALEHFGLSGSYSKKTVSRAMDKGRHPGRDGIKPVKLPDDVVLQLEAFRDLARKTG
jgi:hypothetical protein